MRDYNMMRDMLVFASVAEYVETDIGSHPKEWTGPKDKYK